MKVRALRGVCIGVDRNLNPGDTADLEPSTTAFLVSIGAVERVVDEPSPATAPDDADEAAAKAAPSTARRAK